PPPVTPGGDRPAVRERRGGFEPSERARDLDWQTLGQPRQPTELSVDRSRGRPPERHTRDGVVAGAVQGVIGPGRGGPGDRTMRPLWLLVAQDLPDQRGVRHELVLVHSSRHGAISAARSASQDGLSDRRSVLGVVSPALCSWGWFCRWPSDVARTWPSG